MSDTTQTDEVPSLADQLRALSSPLSEVGPPKTLGGEALKGVEAGLHGLAATGAGLVGLAGDLTDTEAVKDWGLKNYKAQTERTQETDLAPAVGSTSQIRDIGSFGQYAAYNLSKGLTEMAPMVLGGAGGGVIADSLAKDAVGAAVDFAESRGLSKAAAEYAVSAAARQVPREELAATLAKPGITDAGGAAGRLYEAGQGQFRRVFVGSQLGQAVPMTAQSVGDTYGETGDAGAAVKYGGASGLVNSLAFGLVASPAFRAVTGLGENAAKEGFKGFLGDLGKKMATDAAVMGGTAYPSTYLSQAAKASVDPTFDINSPEAQQQRNEAMASGALMGAGFGAAGGALESTAPRTAEILKRIQAQKPETTAGTSAVAATSEGAATEADASKIAPSANVSAPIKVEGPHGDSLTMQKDLDHNLWFIPSHHLPSGVDPTGLLKVGDRIYIHPDEHQDAAALHDQAENALLKTMPPPNAKVSGDEYDYSGGGEMPSGVPFGFAGQPAIELPKATVDDEYHGGALPSFSAPALQGQSTPSPVDNAITALDRAQETLASSPAGSAVQQHLADLETHRRSVVSSLPDNGQATPEQLTNALLSLQQARETMHKARLSELENKVNNPATSQAQVDLADAQKQLRGLMPADESDVSKNRAALDEQAKGFGFQSPEQMSTPSTVKYLQTKLSPEAQELQTKIGGLQEKLRDAQSQLDEHIRKGDLVEGIVTDADYVKQGNELLKQRDTLRAQIAEATTKLKSVATPELKVTQDLAAHQENVKGLKDAAQAARLSEPDYETWAESREASQTPLDALELYKAAVIRGDDARAAKAASVMTRSDVRPTPEPEAPKVHETHPLQATLPFEGGPERPKSEQDSFVSGLKGGSNTTNGDQVTFDHPTRGPLQARVVSPRSLHQYSSELDSIRLAIPQANGSGLHEPYDVTRHNWHRITEPRTEPPTRADQVAEDLNGKELNRQTLEQAGYTRYRLTKNGATADTVFPDHLQQARVTKADMAKARALMRTAGKANTPEAYAEVFHKTGVLPVRDVIRTDKDTGNHVIESHGLFTGDKEATVRQMNAGLKVRASKTAVIDPKSFEYIDRGKYKEIVKVKDHDGHTYTHRDGVFSMDYPAGLTGRYSRRVGYGIYDEIHKSNPARIERSLIAAERERAKQQENPEKSELDRSLRIFQREGLGLSAEEQAGFNDAIARLRETIESRSTLPQNVREELLSNATERLYRELVAKKGFGQGALTKNMSEGRKDLVDSFLREVDNLRNQKKASVADKLEDWKQKASTTDARGRTVEPTAKQVQEKNLELTRAADRGRLTPKEYRDIVQKLLPGLARNDREFLDRMAQRHAKTGYAFSDSNIRNLSAKELGSMLGSDRIHAALTQAEADLRSGFSKNTGARETEHNPENVSFDADKGDVSGTNLAAAKRSGMTSLTEAHAQHGGVEVPLSAAERELEAASIRPRSSGNRVKARYRSLKDGDQDFLHNLGADKIQKLETMLREGKPSEQELADAVKVSPQYIREYRRIRTLLGANSTPTFEHLPEPPVQVNRPATGPELTPYANRLLANQSQRKETTPNGTTTNASEGSGSVRYAGSRNGDGDHADRGQAPRTLESSSRADEGEAGGSESGRTGGHSGVATGSAEGDSRAGVSGADRVGSSPSETRAITQRAARTFVGAAGDLAPEESAGLAPHEVERAHAALSSPAEVGDIVHGNSIIESAAPSLAESVNRSFADRLNTIAAAARERQANSDRAAQIRTNFKDLLRSGAFHSLKEMLQRAAAGKIQTVPKDTQVLARVLLGNNKIDWDKMPTQIGVFTDKTAPDGRAPWTGLINWTPGEKGRQFFVNLDATPERGSATAALIHEMTHALGVDKLRGDGLTPFEQTRYKAVHGIYDRILERMGAPVDDPEAVEKWATEQRDSTGDWGYNALRNIDEFFVGLHQSPELHELLSKELNYDKTGPGFDKKKEPATWDSEAKSLFRNITELVAGRKIDPNSPLGNAFRNAFDLAHRSEQPGLSSEALKGSAPFQRMERFKARESWVRDQVEKRDLHGTRADYDSLRREWEGENGGGDGGNGGGGPKKGTPLFYESTSREGGEPKKYTLADVKNLMEVHPVSAGDKLTIPRYPGGQVNTLKLLADASKAFKSFWGKTVTASDGKSVLLKWTTKTERQAFDHMTRENKTEALNPDKAAMLPLVEKTVQTAPIRLIDPESGHRIFVQRYGKAEWHMVVVDPHGEILDQTKTSPSSLVTQFGYYGRGKQEGFPVEGGNSVPTHPRFDTPRDREKIEGRPGDGNVAPAKDSSSQTLESSSRDRDDERKPVSPVKTSPATIRQNLKNNLYEPDRLPITYTKYQPASERVRQDSSVGEYAARLDGATDVARRSHRAIQEDSQPEPSAGDLSGANGPTRKAAAIDEKELIGQTARPAEEANLRQWAKQSGVYLNGDDFSKKWEEYSDEIGDHAGGLENAVYHDPKDDRYYKTNNLYLDNSFLSFLHRIALHNRAFPDTAYRFEGFHDILDHHHFLATEDKKRLQPVVSQKAVKSIRKAEWTEVRDDMEKRGYNLIPSSDGVFVSPDGHVLVSDLNPDNALVVGQNADGSPKIRYIDPHIDLNPSTKAQRLSEWADAAESGARTLESTSRDLKEIGGELSQGVREKIFGKTIVSHTGKEMKLGGLFGSPYRGVERDVAHAYQGSKFQAHAEEARLEVAHNAYNEAIKKAWGGKPTEEQQRLALSAFGNSGNPLTDEDVAAVEKVAKEKGVDAGQEEARRRTQINREAFRKDQQTAMALLPPEVASAVSRFRDHIDSLTERLVQSGIVTGDLKAAMEANKGIYISRSYDYLDGNTTHADRLKAAPEVARKMETKMRDQIAEANSRRIMEDARRSGKPVSKEEADRMGRDQVTDPEVHEQLNALLSTAAKDGGLSMFNFPGRMNLGSFKERKNLDPDLRAYLGERIDPAIVAADTISKQASILANNSFLKELREYGLKNGFIYDPADPRNSGRNAPVGYTKIAAEGNPHYAPLDGLMMHKEMLAGLERMLPRLGVKDTPWLLDVFRKLTGVAMGMKTQYSPAAQVRHNVSNLLGMVTTANNIKHLVGKDGSAQLLWPFRGNEHKMTNIEQIQHLTRLGVLHQSESMRLYRDLVGPSGQSKLGQTIGKWLSPILDKEINGVKLKHVPETMYGVSDAIYKVAIFKGECEKYAKAFPDWSPEQVESKAAQIALDCHWSYDRSPAIVRELGQVPIVAPFVRFSSEVYRTSYNLIKLAHDEIKEGRATGNAELEKMGWNRVKGMLTVALGPSAFIGMAQAAAGMNNDDQEALRKFLPPWQQNAQIIPFSKGDGKVGYFDLSWWDHYKILRTPIKAMVRALHNNEDFGKGLQDAMVDGMSELFEPFDKEQLLSGALMDIARNKNSATGGTLYNPQDSTANKGSAIVQRMWSALSPGAVDSIERVYKGATGYVSDSGRSYNAGQELANMIGWRAADMDLGNSLRFASGNYTRGAQDATGLFSHAAMSLGSRTPEQIQQGYAAANEAHMNLMQKLRDSYDAAIQLGMTPQQVQTALRGAHVPSTILDQITSGTYNRWEPSTASMNLLQSRGQQDRIQALKEAMQAVPERTPLTRP